MQSLERKKLTIQAETDAVSTIGDLLPFVNQASDAAFEEIKSAIRCDIDKMSLEKTNHIFYHLLSIHTVFPGDLMQHILSFGHCNHHRDVCKRWNALNTQNETNMLCSMYESVNSQYPETANTNTWIMHAQRPHLHDVEVRRGYQGPLGHLSDAEECCQPGDRILVHEGTYWYSDVNVADIHFIGVTNKSSICFVYGEALW